jgi:PAS domain S-box-containing protein
VQSRKNKSRTNQEAPALPDIGQFPDLAATLIDAAQVIIVVLDPSGRIVLINPFMEQLSGYRLSEVKGRDWFDTFLPPEDRAPIRELFQTAVNDLQLTQYQLHLTRDGRRGRDIEWYDKTLRTGKADFGLLSTLRRHRRIKTERALRENERNWISRSIHRRGSHRGRPRRAYPTLNGRAEN